MENINNIKVGQNMNENVPQVLLPDGYLPKNKRKKILLLSDDLRFPSGVGVMSRELVMKTAHRYNWVQLAAGINHPEIGKAMDASDSLSKDIGIPDAFLHIYPYNGYGDHNIIRMLLMREQPNAIVHFTDPRYWIWLYHMEAELREHLPLVYYHVWDDLPPPKYNRNYYRSCDAIFNISRQTHNIVREVLGRDQIRYPGEDAPTPKNPTAPLYDNMSPAPTLIKYIPHGVDERLFRKLTTEEELKELNSVRENVFHGEQFDFVVMYNNRNIRRKVPSDVILAFQRFIQGLPKEKAVKCALLMHTQPVDENGTDLPIVLRDVAPDVKCVFSTSRISTEQLNQLYNLSDVVINLASNEGFGISTLEGMMAEKMIIANVTGGLQDQMGFKDEKGEYLHENIHFNAKFGSNHERKYSDHGEWVVPAFPNNLSLAGSPLTPYIFDDRADWREVGIYLRHIYDMPKEERDRRGKLGREYALSQGYHTRQMCNTFLENMEEVFQTWLPRRRFTLIKA